MPLLRRFAITAFSAAAAIGAALATAPPTAAAPALLPVPLPVVPGDDGLLPDLPGLPGSEPTAPAENDQLTITVSDSGDRALDGQQRTLRCHPASGTHQQAEDACARLDEITKWGQDPFAPTADRANCTMMYGGPSTARVTGTWAGRPVNATFDRRNGCEISRWDRLRPVLPAAPGSSA
ncbi:SSI family serine proteinase inhibitor [Streptomyces pathocidini]|uniref:SSI family serine proteinase inhibitor n=1 Tax=Streptomyces pathocidini TaxID=1650571 RepID=A0ABW7US63_9ACTN